MQDADGSLITDDTSKASELNKYFSSVFTCNVDPPNNNVHPLARTHNTSSSEVKFTPEVVYKAMRAVKRKLSAGPDSIHSIFWANLASSLYLPASIIFNYSYKYNLLLSYWKCAAVTLLLKKSDPCFVTNFSPIYLPSTLYKVMESIVKNKLLDLAQSCKILVTNQHSFTPGKSTSTQLLDCL